MATPAIVGQHGAGEWCRVDDAVNGSVLMLQVNGAVLNAAPRVRVRAFQWCSIMRPVSVPAMVQCRRRVALASCSLQASSCASSYPCRPSRRIISVSSRSVRVVLKLESTQRSTRQSVVGVLYDCVCAVTRTPADAHAHGRTCYHPGRSSGRSNPGTETRWPAGRLFETMA